MLTGFVFNVKAYATIEMNLFNMGFAFILLFADFMKAHLSADLFAPLSTSISSVVS